MCALLGSLFVLVQLAGPTAPAVQTTDDDVEDAEEDLGALEGELGSVSDQLDAAQTRLGEVRDTIATTEAEVEATAKRILGRKDELVDIVQELYKSGATSGLEVLMSAENFSELEQRADYLQSSGEVHLEQLEDFATDRALLLTTLDELDSARDEVAGMLVAVQDLEASLQAQVSDQTAEVDSLQSELEAQRLEEALEAEEKAQRLERDLLEVVQPPPPPPPAPAPAGGVDWDAIAQCESSGDWDIDSTYDGGLQFHPDTWLGYGGGAYARYAWQASREQQIAIAEKVLAAQGPGAWPNCFQYG